MDEDRIQDAISAYASRIARMGGQARAKKLSAKRRKEIAAKASKAAAKARIEKARQRAADKSRLRKRI